MCKFGCFKQQGVSNTGELCYCFFVQVHCTVLSDRQSIESLRRAILLRTKATWAATLAVKGADSGRLMISS